jgi:gliding motility-associated-like protein
MSRSSIISTIALLLLIFIFQAPELNATHIVGGDMTYRCLGNDQYEITLTVRRDCDNGAEDAPFDDPAIIGIFDIFGSLQTHLGEFGRIEIPFMGEDTITDEFLFDCNVLGNPVCVHEAVYRDTFFLPFNKLGYRLAFQRCCRNPILVNIEDPLETGATYDVSIPVDVLTQCNSQPVFNEWADAYICINEELEFDHSATDPDGDELVYRLCTPAQGASSDNPRPFTPSNPPYPIIVWSSPFSLTNMIGGNPTLSINSTTGVITGMPTQVGTYLVGVCVEEYRNGELLSTVRRDFEYNVRVCTDPVDIDFAIEGTGDCDGNLDIGFTNLSMGADSYEWIITDSNGDTIHISELDMFDFVFPGFGTYTVTLAGTRNSDGCTARKSEVIVLGNPDIVPDFTVSFESCDDNKLIRITDASFDPLGTSVPVAWEWTVNGDSAGNTSSILYDASRLTDLEIELGVLFNSNCFGDTSKIVNIDDLFPDIDFEVELQDCTDDGFEILMLSNYTPEGLEPRDILWTINDQGNVMSFSGDSITTVISAMDTEISLEIEFTNDCSDSENRIINASDLLPELSIEFDYEFNGQCPEPGDSVLVTVFPELRGLEIAAEISTYEWIINGISYSTETVQLFVMEGDTLNMSLFITFNNGCVVEATVGTQLIVDFAPEPIIDVSSECSGDTIKVILTDITDFDIQVYEWFVDVNPVQGDSMMMFILGENGNQVDLNLLYENGCSQDYSRFFEAEDFQPELDLNIEVEACEGDTAFVSIDLGDSEIEIIDETIVINGVEYDSLPVDIITQLDSVITVDYFVEYANGCSDMLFLSDLVSSFLPEPGFEVSLLDCLDDGIIITITDNTVYDGDYETNWTIIDGDSIYMFTGPIDSLVIHAPEITVVQDVFFDNGCMASDSTTVSQEDILPELEDPVLDFSITPVECFGDSGIFIFADMTLVPECMYIIDYEWEINGQVCEGNPVTKTIPLGVDLAFSYTVTFNTGLILSASGDTIADNDIINTNDYVESIGIEVGNNNDGFCSDSINLFVVNPDTAVNYEWSADSDFLEILGTGVSLDTVVGPSFEGVIYIQTIENIGPCLYGLDSIFIEFDTIDISFDMPFEICAGDTAHFEVINNNPGQIITYEWKAPGGQLIADGDTNNPLIGIPEDATEDFFLILCTSSDLGCSSVDTIDFNVSQADTLQAFSYSLDSCGSFTVMFNEAPNSLGDAAIWDFGDGNMGSGSMVSHTYADTGVYIVTLMDTATICASEPVSLEILIGDLFIEIEADTIIYDPAMTVTIFAETNGHPDSIQWCTLDGVNVGTGNLLQDFDAMMDTVVLIAKIENGFGCSDQDTVVLVPEVDIDECFDSFEITGPEVPVVCAGEEFQLAVTGNDECDPDAFSYLWNPEDCIISGQGTSVITASAMESKTIMVLVTHIESGQDSVYSFDIEVRNPQPMIEVPEININENGDPFVCLGQTIELTVVPDDPLCEYVWSNSMTGNPIELMPEEDITIFVECIDEFGCSGVSDSLTIELVPPQCDDSDVFIPNAFSPDGDNVNDILFVRSKFIETMELIIVNRWGQVVFETTDPTEGWDGTFNGTPLSPGAFSYSLTVTCFGGATYVKTGNVSIIL